MEIWGFKNGFYKKSQEIEDEDWIFKEPIIHGEDIIKRVVILVSILNTKTQEIISFEDQINFDEENNSADPFWWSEWGNGGCDCNREIHFNKSKGVEDWDGQCSKGRFQVNLKNKKNNKIFYQEYEITH